MGPRKREFPTEGETLIVTTLKVPKTGGLPTTKINVVRWLKQEGEVVKRGDAVVELETEKANYELDSPAEGILLKILAQECAELPQRTEVLSQELRRKPLGELTTEAFTTTMGHLRP